jgi:hypothetical protein
VFCGLLQHIPERWWTLAVAGMPLFASVSSEELRLVGESVSAASNPMCFRVSSSRDMLRPWCCVMNRCFD